MSDQFNLLDLPDLVLEEILFYCRPVAGKMMENINTLLNLTRCCKFLKNYIETNPRLMRRLILKVPTTFLCDYDKDERENKQKLKACLASSRKYVEAKFYYVYRWASDKDEPEIEEKKVLADKHSDSIKIINFMVMSETDSKIFPRLLKYLEKLENVEEVNVRFFFTALERKVARWENPSDWNWSEYGDSYIFPNKFNYLRKLSIKTESPTVFNIFESCENIKTLKLTGFGLMIDAEYDKLGQLINNSRENLKTLEVQLDQFNVGYYVLETYEDKLLENFAKFLRALVKPEIDLATFKMTSDSVTTTSTDLLFNFLKSQKNLENLSIDHISGEIVNKKFEDVMAELLKLKTLQLVFGPENFKRIYEYYGSEEENEDKDENVEEANQNYEFLSKPWNLQGLEELQLNYRGRGKCQVPCNLFQKTIDKLKKITFKGNLKLYDSFFENISKNLGSLIELKIEYTCSDYSSNDIFWILKHLKKLKVLQFGFPDGSELNPDLFVNNENLNLPVIEKVELRFNDSIDVDSAMKLLHFMSNMSEFQFKYWKDYSTDFLVIVTRELSNLADLRIEEDTIEIEYSVLLKMQSNVREFNKKPNRFRIYYEGIDHWVEKAQKIAAENNEAGCSMSKKLRLKPYFYSVLYRGANA